jgi:hypothetical protein
MDVVAAKEAVSIWQDWKFWSLCVSALALLLSQLPPIKTWFRKAKLELEVYSSIHLTHKIGNPNIQLHLILRNTGGKKAKVNSIKAKVLKDNKEVASLPAQTTMSRDNRQILLTSFILKPEDEWSETINLLNYFDRKTGQKYRACEKSVVNKIYQLRKLQPDTIVKVDDSDIEPLKEIFDSLFIWEDGEYELKLEIDTDINKSPIKSKYRFVIYESQAEELKDYVKDYNTGAGVSYDYIEHKGLIVDLQKAV